MEQYIGQIVAMQFTGQILLFRTVAVGDMMMPVPLEQNGQSVATQAVDSVKLLSADKEWLSFAMKHPDGSEVEACVARNLVACLWVSTKLPSSILKLS